MKQIEEAAANLIKLSQKIDTQKMNQPSFLMVLTGGQAAYRRSDGVLIVPIGCLKDWNKKRPRKFLEPFVLFLKTYFCLLPSALCLKCSTPNRSFFRTFPLWFGIDMELKYKQIIFRNLTSYCLITNLFGFILTKCIGCVLKKPVYFSSFKQRIEAKYSELLAPLLIPSLSYCSKRELQFPGWLPEDDQNTAIN